MKMIPSVTSTLWKNKLDNEKKWIRLHWYPQKKGSTFNVTKYCWKAFPKLLMGWRGRKDSESTLKRMQLNKLRETKILPDACGEIARSDDFADGFFKTLAWKTQKDFFFFGEM